MYMTEQQRLADARVLASTWDKLVRNPKRITPTAPWIIPATMIFVACFAFICLVIKLFINYLGSKSGGPGSKTKKYGLYEASSPELPMTPTEDQASMATTASMKTREGSSRLGSRRSRGAASNRPPAVSLYQIKQMQSPASTSSPGSATAAAVAAVAAAAATSKSKQNKAAMKALAKAAKSEANKSRNSNTNTNNRASDNDNNSDDNQSPSVDLDQSPSQHSGDSDELQQGAGAVIFGASRLHDIDEPDTSAAGGAMRSSHEPEVHIVQIRDLEDNLQHSQPSWPQAESEI